MTKRAISIQLRPDLNELLQSTLDKHQIELNVCASQNEARRAMLKENYCLAVIDTSMLETEKAVQSITDFRLETYAPILSLNADDTAKQILNAGADMCFSVSASPELIVFHAMSVLRRYTLYNLYDEMKPGDAVLHRGDLMIDPIRQPDRKSRECERVCQQGKCGSDHGDAKAALAEGKEFLIWQSLKYLPSSAGWMTE